MPIQENMSLVRKYYDSFNSRKFDEGRVFIDNSCEFINPVFGTNLKGPDGYKKGFEVWLKAFPDGKVKINNIIAGEDFVAVEFTGSGNNTGTLSTPQGEIKPTRKLVNLPFCEVLNIKSGKIVRSVLYYDLASMLRQMGVLAEVKH
ncbi:MAG: ester cyclase [Bacillota bacterium]